jgi:hypothetical protein
MRKLVLLVGILALMVPSAVSAGLIPTVESPSGNLGFYPITNEISLYKNYDDTGEDRGQTLQFVLINTVRVWTTFNIEFTADYNFDYTPGLDRDHYVELSLVKPVTPLLSLNYQRVISSFEDSSINQFGLRLSF